MEILECKLLEPEAAFKVTDAIKDGVLPPGSIGFISYIHSIDESYQNIAKTLATVIRKGKGGKDRLLHMMIYLPVFYVEHKSFMKLMPQEGSKKGYVHVVPYALGSSDVMQLSPMEFIGWAAAITKRLKRMSENSRHKKWPEQKSNPLNVMKSLHDYFDENPPEYTDKYSRPEFRESFVLESRRLMSSMVRLRLQDDMRVAEVVVNAAEFLLFVNKGEFIPKDSKDKENEYQFMDDNKVLKATKSSYIDKKEYIKSLFNGKKIKT